MNQREEGDTVTRHEEEFRHLVRIEQHLQNAVSDLRTAEMLSGHGMLRDHMRTGREALEEALELATRAKRMMLSAWRQTATEHRAA
jgi:formylmethanofuran dehydrogenase subunit B